MVLMTSHYPGLSHPSRGAWIEIGNWGQAWEGIKRRTPHGVRGLKFRKEAVVKEVGESHPSRGAWIEITVRSHVSAQLVVAPLTGCVD